MSIKTDRNDARGIAQLMRMGWFRPVHAKSVGSREVRALLVARKQLLSKLMDLEASMRGILRGFGLKMGVVTPISNPSAAGSGWPTDLAFGCGRSSAIMSGPMTLSRTAPTRDASIGVLDEFTHECLAIRVGRKLKAIDVIDVLSDLFILQGIPAYIRSDNGPEFVAKAVQEWIAVVGAKTTYIERGSPWENGYIESFNARLRDELLDGEIFYTLREEQHTQAACIARIQAASTGGICPCLRRVAGCVTPTGSAGHAGATANLKLTFHLDHSVGAHQCHIGDKTLRDVGDRDEHDRDRAPGPIPHPEMIVVLIIIVAFRPSRVVRLFGISRFMRSDVVRSWDGDTNPFGS
jgi:transposase InsO family protein